MDILLLIGIGTVVAVAIGLMLLGLDEIDSGDKWADRALYDEDEVKMQAVIDDHNEGR